MTELHSNQTVICKICKKSNQIMEDDDYCVNCWTSDYEW